MFNSFKDKEPSDENLARYLSAEIHSLVRIGIDKGSRILLLASETIDGQACALALKKYLESYWKGIDVQTKKIEGLQVQNADRFRQQGVINFIKEAIAEIDCHGNNVILNPTGGYKALVPYMVLLGMIKSVKCNYIFERSTSLLELPPLPIEFDRNQFEVHKELFEQIERDSSISKQDWGDKVSYEDRSWFEPLVEEMGDNQITLSAAGFLFLEAMQKPAKKLVSYLSKQAIKDCFENIATLDNRDPFRYLNQVSKSGLNEDNVHIHTDGLYWLKPGRTTDRYLVSTEDWRLLVWRVIREDQVGKDYSTKIKVDPAKERNEYAPFMRMDFVT
nr:putative CRISPR-associated protein [Petrachloros mirabilis]